MQNQMIRSSIIAIALACLFSACNTLNQSDGTPQPVLTPEAPMSILDNIPNFNREKLIKVLPLDNERFLVVGYNDNVTAGLDNTAFIRRYFTSANGVGLDTTFGLNGQIAFNAPGVSERFHDAVLFQEPGTLIQQVLIAGSTIMNNQRRPALSNINLLSNPGSSSVTLFPFFEEEATVINLTRESPPRVVMGLRGSNGSNQLRVMRLARVLQTPQFNIDPTFSGDGVQEFNVPASNAVFIDLDLTDLELTATNNVVLSGTGFSFNGLNGLIPAGFVCTLNTVTSASNCNPNLALQHANAIAINASNQIVVAGQSGVRFAVTRLNSNLTTDATFNQNLGLNSICFQMQFQLLQPPKCLKSQAVDVALDTQGRIVAAGDTVMLPNQLGPSRAMAIARFNANGVLDTTFGTNGQRTIGEGVDTDTQTSSLALFNLNRFVVGGTVTPIGLPNANSTLSIQRFIDP
jgi:uncharacterized delta-60 repeat protein